MNNDFVILESAVGTGYVNPNIGKTSSANSTASTNTPSQSTGGVVSYLPVVSGGLLLLATLLFIFLSFSSRGVPANHPIKKLLVVTVFIVIVLAVLFLVSLYFATSGSNLNL